MRHDSGLATCWTAIVRLPTGTATFFLHQDVCNGCEYRCFPTALHLVPKSTLRGTLPPHPYPTVVYSGRLSPNIAPACVGHVCLYVLQVGVVQCNVNDPNVFS
jgi:hypothetical protein